ncbi:MAG: DNA primase [Candidatus Binatia bacterium]
MAERISEDILADIRARVSIVEIVSTHVALRKTGRSYSGLCPFHGEKTPSFSVNEEGGFFHCFGCGVGGNVFTFLMRIEGLSFPEAVRRLASKAGIPLPQMERDPHAQERARLYKLNEIAATYFQRCLWGNVGEAARRYLTERGLGKEIAEQFRLGFSPPGTEGLVRFLKMQNADVDKASVLGLIGKREDGRYYDKFRYRLMFPITDVVGRIVGFGGRLLPLTQETKANTRYVRPLPKYLNSPESIIYKKGTLLYGLSQAKEAIQQKGRAILVEGYIDLLAIVQGGQAETVAVLGTALGVEQLKLLRRFTPEVYMFFDGDEAGRRAATRAFPLCVEAEVRGRGVFLPHGEDPDTFVRTNGREALQELIDRAEALEDFYFSRHAPPPGASALQRAQAARVAMDVLKSVSDTVARGALVTQIAQHFRISEEDLRRLSASQAPGRPAMGREALPTARRETQSPSVTAETEILQLMLVDRSVAEQVIKENIIPLFQRWGKLAIEIATMWQQRESVDLGTFLDRLPKMVAGRVTRLYAIADQDGEAIARQQLLSDCIAKMKSTQRRAERERLRQELRNAEQQGNEEELRIRLAHLQWGEGQE